MGKQTTEMLKGTLEGFSDIAEGTVYALLVRIEQRGLVDVEKVPSEKGPPRKVYTLNAQGGEYLDEFWKTWSFLAERIEQLHHRIERTEVEPTNDGTTNNEPTNEEGE